MRLVKELINTFSVIQTNWKKKFPNVSTTEEICSVLNSYIEKRDKDKIELSGYVVLLVYVLRKTTSYPELENLNLSDIENIPEILLNTPKLELFKLLLALETCLNSI